MWVEPRWSTLTPFTSVFASLRRTSREGLAVDYAEAPLSLERGLPVAGHGEAGFSGEWFLGIAVAVAGYRLAQLPVCLCVRLTICSPARTKCIAQMRRTIYLLTPNTNAIKNTARSLRVQQHVIWLFLILRSLFLLHIIRQ